MHQEDNRNEIPQAEAVAYDSHHSPEIEKLQDSHGSPSPEKQVSDSRVVEDIHSHSESLWKGDNESTHHDNNP